MIRRYCALFLFAVPAFAQIPVIAGTPAGILDAGSYTPNLALGSIFVVKGQNLAPAGFQQATLPLPPTLNGVSVTFTPAAGGAAVSAFMVYTYNLNGVQQLAAVLPSTLTPGNYNVQVSTSGGKSAAVSTTVTARKFTLITADSTGSGAAALQNFVTSTQYDLNRFSTGSLAGTGISPAHPGQVLIAYGTGLGAVQTPDNVAPGTVDFRGAVNIQVLVGGQTVPVDLYAGRAPQYPGEDQIDFTLPANVQTGCAVPFQVQVGNQVSNPTTIAIAPAGGNTCVSAQFTAAQLQKLDQGGGLVTGFFNVSQQNTTAVLPIVGSATIRLETVSGQFTRYSGSQIATALTFFQPPGGCQLFQRVGTTNQILFGDTGTNLDAGASLTLSGPNSLKTQLPNSNATPPVIQPNFYSGTIDTVIPDFGIPLPPGSGLVTTPAIVNGAYTLTGTGGKDVGPFSAGLTLSGGTITPTAALPTTVDRSKSLTISWTGGTPASQVALLVESGATVPETINTDNPVYNATAFLCTTTADKGSITVPASLMSQLPVTPSDAFTNGTGSGILYLLQSTIPAAGNGVFTAPLIAGGSIDVGAFVLGIGTVAQTLYQ